MRTLTVIHKTLHVIDPENQVIKSGRKTTLDDVKVWWHVYKQQGPGVGKNDYVLVGLSPRSLWMAKAFTGAKVSVRVGHNGPDGADGALLASVYMPDVAKDFDAVNIVSGDGGFTGLAKQARDRGLLVRLVTTGDTGIYAKLRAAAHVHTHIREISRTAPVAKPTEEPARPQAKVAPQRPNVTPLNVARVTKRAA